MIRVRPIDPAGRDAVIEATGASENHGDAVHCPRTPKEFGGHGTHRVRDQLVARCREIRELETVDEAEAKGTRLLALEGQTARQGFSPSLLFAAAFDARPPPSRGYALSRLPTSVEGSSIDGPRSPEGREAQNHGATPSPMGAARPTTIRQQHVSGPQPAVHMKPRRLGVPGSPHWELRSKMPANDPTKGWGLPERPRFR